MSPARNCALHFTGFILCHFLKDFTFIYLNMGDPRPPGVKPRYQGGRQSRGNTPKTSPPPRGAEPWSQPLLHLLNPVAGSIDAKEIDVIDENFASSRGAACASPFLPRPRCCAVVSPLLFCVYCLTWVASSSPPGAPLTCARRLRGPTYEACAAARDPRVLLPTGASPLLS